MCDAVATVLQDIHVCHRFGCRVAQGNGAAVRRPARTPILVQAGIALAVGGFVFSAPRVSAQGTPTSAPAYAGKYCDEGWTEAYKQLEGCLPSQLAGGGALTTQQMELQFGQAFMRGAIQGFVGAMQRSAANAAAARQQQAAFQAEMIRRQQDAEQQRRIAEQQRIAAIFARLDSELKLSDLPFQVSMKEADLPGPQDMRMKGMDEPGLGGVKMKFGDDNGMPTSTGMKGLPGIYTGGSGSDAAQNTSDATPTGGTGADAPASNPNLASEPGSGTTGSGIPGLPGLYLDGAQPNQAPQLAQAALNLAAGPERDITEDTALQAAQHNSALTASTQDPQVTDFQKDDLNYQQALQTTNTASQQFNAAQSQVAADQSAIATAKAELASLQPNFEQQAALSQMLNAAKTDEAAAEDARGIFEDANAHLSLARTQATESLSRLPRDPTAAPIRLSRNVSPIPLRLPGPVQSYASASGHPLLPVPAPPESTQSAPMQPDATPAQLCAQLTGAQTALRRLIETQKMHNDDFAKWGSSVDEASDDAWQRGLDMVRDFMGKGANAYIQKKIDGTDEEIRQLYLRVSSEKNPSSMAEAQKEWEALEQHKLNLQDALERAKKNQKQLDVLAEERDFHDWNERNKGDLNGNLEGVREIVDNLIGDEDLQKRLGISEASDAIKYGESILDSSYDILSEVLAAQRIKQLNRNTEQFLQAQNALQHRIESTVARLNIARRTAPAAEASCSAYAARQ